MVERIDDVREVDVAVVGVGIAGAFALRSIPRSLSVVGIDRKEILGYPVECGEIVPTKREMKTLLPELEDYSIFDIPSKFESNRTKLVNFILPNGRTFEVEFEFHVLRRDEMIQRVAQNSGHDIITGTRVTEFANGELTTTAGRIKSRIVIASDGANSKIAKLLGVWKYELSPAKQYVMRGVECDEDVVYMYIGRKISPGAYGWIIPKGDGIANVGIGFRPGFAEKGNSIHKALNTFIRDYSYSARYLKNAEIMNKIGAVVPIDKPLERAVRDNVIFAGDSASMVISHVGGGIPTAMVAGDLAGKVVAEYFKGGKLERYDALWKKYLYKPLMNAYFYRNMWDKFSDSDERIVKLMSLLSNEDMGAILRCRIPFKVKLGSKFLPILKYFL
jgi:geranylgeranyl reductase family protein